MAVIDCPFCGKSLQIEPDTTELRKDCQCGSTYFIEPDHDSYRMELAEEIYIPVKRSIPVTDEKGRSFHVVFY